MPAPDDTGTGDAALRDLAAALGHALLDRGLRLAAAESCTGGWIAKALTDVPGSSEWLEAGFVTYSNVAKIRMLGVSHATLEAHGAVSEAVVREMATGARRAAGTEAAVAVSGVAGPGGGTPDKPVGLVHFAWSVGDRDWASHALLAGDRESVRRQSVGIALRSLLDAISADRQGPKHRVSTRK